MRRDHIRLIARIFVAIATDAREDYEFAELDKVARYLEKIQRLPGENGTRGKVHKQINRTEELIAILLGLEASIINLGKYYIDIEQLQGLSTALDIVQLNLTTARRLRGRLAG